MNTFLPQIRDRNHYEELFKESSHWARAVAFVAEKHQLKGEIRRGVFGSHVVYRVGDCWLKLMAPLFAGEMAYELSGLRAVEEKLTVETPNILATGELEGWPYLITNHIEGEPIRNVWPKYDLNQKLKLAEQIARITLEISSCEADEILRNRFVWNEFIQKQYDTCEEIQKEKGLPAEWLPHLPSYLRRFNISEFQTTKPVLLHADLHYEHFLVVGGDTPKISGIIDMADSQVGHFEYELVAPTAFIFNGNQALLRSYLSSCGVNQRDLNQRYSEKLLGWALLHRYCRLNNYFKKDFEACKPGDFPALAQKIFPLET